jgi:hypothetical protein
MPVSAFRPILDPSEGTVSLAFAFVWWSSVMSLSERLDNYLLAWAILVVVIAGITADSSIAMAGILFGVLVRIGLHLIEVSAWRARVRLRWFNRRKPA